MYFTQDKNELIANATSAHLRSVDVITVYLNLEPVPFNKGFYSVDMTFFFDVCLDICAAPASASVVVSGIAIFNKKVILYGGEGNVKSFSSDNACEAIDPACSRVVPTASVQVAQPIGLEAYVKDCCSHCDPCCQIPEGICRRYGGGFDCNCRRGIYIAVGLFTIVQIVRNVQMLIPTYDFCIPEKECTTSTSDSPCDMFSRIDFPTDEFFPPKAGSDSFCDSHCSCQSGQSTSSGCSSHSSCSR